MTAAETVTRSRTHEWEDPLPAAAAARELDGLTYLRGMMNGEYPAPPFAATLDMTLTSVEPGRVEFGIVPAEYPYNPIGSVHGGVMATLLDSAAGCAVHSRLAAGTLYTSLDLTVKFLRPLTTRTGQVRCVGEVVQLGRRTALAQSQLLDADDRVLAHAISSLLIFQADDRPSGA